MSDFFIKLRTYTLGKILKYTFYEFKYLLVKILYGSYSQFGEDMVIDNLLNNKKRGFYVDVGAYDPDRFSNTKRFYLKGWRGINIEPDVYSFNKFLEKRPEDIN